MSDNNMKPLCIECIKFDANTKLCEDARAGNIKEHITGNFANNSTWLIRQHKELFGQEVCGPDGKWFEPKNKEPETIPVLPCRFCNASPGIYDSAAVCIVECKHPLSTITVRYISPSDGGIKQAAIRIWNDLMRV